MNNEVTFSIIIPTYNRASFIRKTIESVLKQTFQDFEIIVVDDGSTDATSEVVAGIKDNRLRYHYKENEERAAARNAGTRLSKGNYISFLDSDDLIYENHLATALEIVEKYQKPEWFHLGFEIKNTFDGSTQIPNPLPTIANDLLISGNLLSCNGVFLRHDIAKKYPFNAQRDLSATEDYELWLRLASRFPLYCDNRVTSVILQHDARSVINTNHEKLIKRIQILEDSLARDKEFVDKFSGRLAEFRANNRIYIALHLALTKKNRIGAIKYLTKSLFFSVKSLKQRAFYGTIKRIFI